MGKTNLSWQKADQWLPGTGTKGEWLQETQGNFFGGLETLYILIRMQLITHVYTIIKTYTGQLK